MPRTAALLEPLTPTTRPQITRLFELAVSTLPDAPERRAKLPRHVTVAMLYLLAEWLAEQARNIAEESPIERTNRPGGKLTPRELEVAACIARGMTNAQIGCELVIATSTVERHVANILIKLHMQSRAQVAAWVTTRNGIRG